MWGLPGGPNERNHKKIISNISKNINFRFILYENLLATASIRRYLI